MRQLKIKPVLYKYDNCMTFIKEFDIGKGDLVLTNKIIFNPYFGELDIKADVLFLERYGSGEPSDETVEAMRADMGGPYRRVVAIGHGGGIDLAKLWALENAFPVLDLFDRKLEMARNKELIVVPAACGSGGEMTNLSTLRLKGRRMRAELAAEEFYADYAVMIPQLLEGLPYRMFASGSIDAFIHAAESYVSPKATSYTRLFAERAMETILKGYGAVLRDGEMARLPYLGDFLAASNHAGISHGNAGVGAVRAMANPLCGALDIPPAEAGYSLFFNVFRVYLSKRDDGAIADLGRFLAGVLGCGIGNAFAELSRTLGGILPCRPLREFGVGEEDLSFFTENAVMRQGRLMANNFVPLTPEDVLGIYRASL